MIQIATGIFFIIGGVALLCFGMANHLADPAKVRIVGVKSVGLEYSSGRVDSVQPEEWLYLRPGAAMTIASGGKDEAQP